MARKLTQEINWKPRRQQGLEGATSGVHVQMHLPFIVNEVLAGDENRVELVAAEPGELPQTAQPAVLPWEPRSSARNP